MKNLLIILFFAPLFAIGQLSPEKQAKVDSLQQVIKTAKHDSIVVIAWYGWDNIIYASDPELDVELNKKIDSLCNDNLEKALKEDENQFFLRKKAAALFNIGLIYFYKSDYDKAIKDLH